MPSKGCRAATFTVAETGYVLSVGVISGVVPTLQPMLLGQLAAEARIGFAEIGQAATLEALGMLISVSLAGALLKPDRLKPIAAAAIISMMAINILTANLTDTGILIARFLGGLSAGMLLWIWVGMLARTAVSGRLASLYVMFQTALLVGLTTMLSGILLPWKGAQAGYGVLCLLYGLLLLFVPNAPNHYVPLKKTHGVALPSGRGLFGLCVICLHMAAYMGVWVYLVPLAKQAGLADKTAGLAITCSIGVQFLAGFLAGLLAARLNASLALIVSIIISIFALFVLTRATTDVLFIASVAVLAFSWMFAVPFQAPYLIMADPSRKAVLQIVSAQLLGVAAGPALSSSAVVGGDVSGGLGVSIAVFASAGLLLLLGTLTRPLRASEDAVPSSEIDPAVEIGQ